MTKYLKIFISRLLKIYIVLGLRASYRRRPIDLSEYIYLLPDQNPKFRRSLDIGSGPNPRNPFKSSEIFGVDIRSYDINANVKKCLIGFDQIPFENSYFDCVTAYDVLEHIPRFSKTNESSAFPFVSAINEVWRVLKVGGVFYSQTPCYPMKEVFQDPTHVNIMTEDTLRFYFAEQAWARIYGYVGSFQLIAEGWCGSHYFCILRKISDKPLCKMNEPQHESI